MLLFELPRTLFRFSAQAPALLPLFQLPPLIAQSMLSPRRTSRRKPAGLLRIAAQFFLHPPANHAANFIDQP